MWWKIFDWVKVAYWLDQMMDNIVKFSNSCGHNYGTVNRKKTMFTA